MLKHKPEEYTGTWVLMKGRAYRVWRAYYGILTRDLKSSVDATSPSGDRGIILHVRGYQIQTWVRKPIALASPEQIKTARRGYWAVVWAFSCFGAGFVGAALYGAHTLRTTGMTLESRLDLLFDSTAVIAVLMVIGAAIGYSLPWDKKKAPRA